MYRKLTLIFGALLILALSGSAQVILNEVYYDNPGGENADVLFTELWGSAGTSLAGWSMVGINGNDGNSYRTVVLSGTIPADGYFVVGNTASVPNVDLNLNVGTSAGVDWQNAGFDTDDCDGVELRNASNVVVDHVCYGICATPGNCEGEGGTNAPDYSPPSPSAPSKSIGRFPDRQDTDDNGQDWTILEPPSPGGTNSGLPCDPHTVILSDIRENDANGMSVMSGDFVIVSGIVNVDNHVFDDTTSSFYMQDEDAGVNIFGGTVPAGIVAGDCVTVSAWVGQYNGLTELISGGSGDCIYLVDVTDHVDPPDPALLTTASFFESFEGMLGQINNVTIVDGDWPGQGQFANLTISDGNGTLILRIDDDTNIDGSPEPQGAFNIVGIITQFDNSAPYADGYQITPRSTADFHPLSADDPRDVAIIGEFKLQGAYPNPFNSVTQIRYEVGTVRDLTLRIFDLMGREVAVEKLTNLTPGTHTFTWNASGATGLYFIRMESGAAVQTAKALFLR